MITKMLPVPVAAATRLATIGMIDWPMRLAMVRSEFAVPMAPPLAMASTPAMLAVIEMLNAKSGDRNGGVQERQRQWKSQERIGNGADERAGQRERDAAKGNMQPRIYQP